MNSVPAVRCLPILLSLVMLAGCTLGRESSPLSVLDPRIVIEPSETWQPVDWSIQVQRPVADQMRDSDRVLVRRAASRLQVYAGAAWLDSVPEMLRSITIEALGDSGMFAGVGRVGGIRTRYSLAMEVRRFEAVDDGGADLKVDLVVHVSLIHQRSSRPVASQTFRQAGQARGKGLDSLVESFEDSLQILITNLAGWVLEEGRQADALIEQEESAGRRERGR